MAAYAIAAFAQAIGVRYKTLLRWDCSGRLKPIGRTPGNRRLYSEEQLREITHLCEKRQPKRLTIAQRVSSQCQSPDLKNQQAALEQFCLAQGLIVDEWIAEIGGGMNFRRPKFLQIGTVWWPVRLARWSSPVKIV